MIALLQRVTKAQVTIAGEIIASIGPGLLVLVGIERGDSISQATRLLERLLSYRVFSDAQGRMNQNLADIKGNLLLVPQFTLAADTRNVYRNRRKAWPNAGGEIRGRACAQLINPN